MPVIFKYLQYSSTLKAWYNVNCVESAVKPQPTNLSRVTPVQAESTKNENVISPKQAFYVAEIPELMYLEI